MKRQRTRQLTILVGFLLMPAALYYFSPFLPIVAGLSGIIAGSIATFAALFVSALFLNRAFCGWLCPMGGMQEACFSANPRRAKGGAADKIKWLIFVPWISALAYIIIKVGPKTISLTYQTTNGFSLGDPVSYFVYYIVVALLLVMSLTLGKRAFCHHACWVAPFMIAGATLGKLIGLPSLHLTGSPGKCTGCQRCSTACPMSLDVSALVRRGQPHHSECIQCGSCADVCPAKAIRLGVSRPNTTVTKSRNDSEGPDAQRRTGAGRGPRQSA